MGIRVKIRNIENKTRKKRYFQVPCSWYRRFCRYNRFCTKCEIFFGFVLYFRKIIFLINLTFQPRVYVQNVQ